MKCAFADVVTVKRKLVDVKEKQGSSENGDDDDEWSSNKRMERQLELTLLGVASRVADIHNNMGVVHEMDRDFDKARQSYADALEVYHNTCKRFEGEGSDGDADVNRTRKNIERMTLACESEGERRGLHDEARRLSGRAADAAARRGATSRQQHARMLGEAAAVLRRALDVEVATLGASHPVAASTLVQIGKYHYEMREYNDAVKNIREAVNILRNALGTNHPQVGKTMLLLASIYERHGDGISRDGEDGAEDDNAGGSMHDIELELYVDALEPLKATLGEVHSEVGYLVSLLAYGICLRPVVSSKWIFNV